MPRMIRTGLLILLCAAHVSTAAQAPAARARPHAEALKQECDALLEQLVKRPYGWGWQEKSVAAREPVVSFEPQNTPAAGLLLLLGADVLEDRRYADAAANVGRLVAASVQPSGQ